MWSSLMSMWMPLGMLHDTQKSEANKYMCSQWGKKIAEEMLEEWDYNQKHGKIGQHSGKGWDKDGKEIGSHDFDFYHREDGKPAEWHVVQMTIGGEAFDVVQLKR